MKSLSQYAFTNAKVRAMLSSLLDKEKVQILLGSKDVEELIDILKGSIHSDCFSSMELPYDIKSLERKLWRNSVEVTKKIHKTLKGNSQKLAFEMLTKYETVYLKNILRMWNNENAIEERDLWIEETICYPLPVKELLRAESIEEIIVLLDKTPYRQPLIGARGYFKEKKSLFYLEHALDRDYYKRIEERINKLGAKDKRLSERLFGIEIDIENIANIVRFKHYYKLSKEEAIMCFIPGGYKTGKEFIYSLYSENMETAKENKMLYKEIISFFQEDNIKEKINEFEVFLWKILLKETRRALTQYPFTIATVVAFLNLYAIEVKNIISLLYGKKYGCKKEDIERGLLC